MNIIKYSGSRGISGKIFLNDGWYYLVAGTRVCCSEYSKDGVLTVNIKSRNRNALYKCIYGRPTSNYQWDKEVRLSNSDEDMLFESKLSDYDCVVISNKMESERSSLIKDVGESAVDNKVVEEPEIMSNTMKELTEDMDKVHEILVEMDKRREAEKQKKMLNESIVQPVLDGMTEKVVDPLLEGISMFMHQDKTSNWVRPFRNSFIELDDSEPTFWNQAQIDEMIKALDHYGLNLIGQAGTGKGYIAENIGYEIKKRKGYNKVLYCSITCGLIPPYLISHGVGIDGKMYLGIILEGALKAKENPDCVVVVHVDEITRMDFLSTVSCIFKFLGTKGESTEILADFGEPIKYADNLYIICTANVGRGYKTANESERALDQRFKRFEVKGILENEDTFLAFMERFGDTKIFDYLNELYKRLDKCDKKDIDRSISTRLVLNNLDNENVTASDLDLSEEMTKLMKGDSDGD